MKIFERVRSYISALKTGNLVYLDSAATTLKPEKLVQAYGEWIMQGFGAAFRSIHQGGERSASSITRTRAFFALRHGVLPEEIVFTAGTTASLNAVAGAWGHANLCPGDEILISIAEHHSSLLPWYQLAAEKNCNIRFFYPSKETFLFESSELIFSEKTKVLVATSYSNVLGPVWSSLADLKQVISAARARGIITVIDGAQQAPFECINLRTLDPDFYAYSGHKMMGPSGVGLLFVNKARHHELQPFMTGGGMVETFKPATVDAFIKFRPMPYLLEAGSMPMEEIYAWGSIVRWMDELLQVHNNDSFEHLMTPLVECLQSIEGMHILGNVEYLKKQGHVISFVVDQVHAHDIAHELSEAHIAVRAGTMCAQPLFEWLEQRAAVRISFGWYTTPEDIGRLCKILPGLIAQLRNFYA